MSLSPLSQRVPKHNSSYCQGRQRLPLEVLSGVLRLSAASIHQEVAAAAATTVEHSRARERTVLLLDGSTLLLQAQAALVEHYGSHGNQHGPGHWPVLRVVGAFDLFTGAIAHVTDGKLEESEQALAVQGMRAMAVQPAHLKAAEAPEAPIYVADSNFGVYSIVHAAATYGNDVVVRLTESRFKACLRRAGRKAPLLSGEECVVAWEPSKHDQILAVAAATDEAEDTSSRATSGVRGRCIYWHLERPGYQAVKLYLFTTLMDEARYPAAALVELYGQRWHVELALRYVKEALGLSQLQARTVEMVRKELVAGCLCYNLIRGLMAAAAIRVQLRPLDLSFKRCWRRIRDVAIAWPPRLTADQTEQRLEHLMKLLGDCTIYRTKQQRTYQRAVRKRPCPYPLLIGKRIPNNGLEVKSL